MLYNNANVTQNDTQKFSEIIFIFTCPQLCYDSCALQTMCCFRVLGTVHY